MRNFTVTGVGHTGITVSDMDKSLCFYRDVLGFQVSDPVHMDDPSIEQFVGVPGAELDMAFVRAPGHVIELLRYTKPENRDTSHLRPCDSGFLHLCFKVLNIDKVVEAMRAGGFEPIGQIQNVDDGPTAGMRAVYTRDPDGVLIELIEDRPGLVFEDLFLGNAGHEHAERSKMQ